VKIRNGFVSNSSSSSFIIGVAEILDLEAFKKALDKDLKSSHYFEFGTCEKLLEGCICERRSMVRVEVSSFTGESVSLPSKPNANYFVVSYFGEEGDYSFMADEGSDIDYDIDASFFDCLKDVKRLLEMLSNPEKHGLGETKYSYGAGRNG